MIPALKSHLHQLKSFFIKNDSGYQASFRFAICTFLIEFVSFLYTFHLISSNTRFKGILSLDNLLIIFVIVYFVFRVFLLHIALGFILRIVESIFRIDALKFGRAILYSLLVFYAYLYIAIKYPQNFDELPFISLLLKSIRLFEIPWILHLPPLGLLLLSFYSFFKFQKKTILTWLTSAAAIFLFFFYFVSSQQLDKTWTKPESPQAAEMPTPHEKPNIIFITLDSLRGDVPIENHPEISEAVKKYLARSYGFERVVSPIAQTHGALSSLFTGNNPTSTEVRTNLSHQTLDVDKFLNHSLLSQLKDSGYELRFLQDVAEYSNFYAGNIIDHVQAPNYSVNNVVTSNFFKNRIVYGLFNNPLGYFFLPELKNNTSFFYSYDLSRFTVDALQELQEIPNKKTPVFLFMHTCALHWPGVLPYPYYPQDSYPAKSNAPFSYTSKFRGFSSERISPKAWQDQAQFNSKIYDSAVKMTVEKFLNPIFEKIYQLGLEKNSLIVLLSDHGEDLWLGPSKFPVQKTVQHGSSLIFGASSELSFLRLGLPENKGGKVPKTVGIVDVLPTVMDFAGVPPKNTDGVSLKPAIQASKEEDRFYYTETGLWPLKMFKGQFVATPPSSLGPFFRLSPSHMNIYVDPKFLPGIIQQKQRAVYYKSYRFTLYPTDYGLQEFLCERDSDPECQENILSAKPEVAAKMRTFLQLYIQKDIKSGALKIGACSPYNDSPNRSVDLSDIANYQWQYYFQALECLHNSGDYSYVSSIFDRLLNSPEISQHLKEQIERSFLNLCSHAGAFSKEKLPGYLQKLVKLDFSDLEKEQVPFPYSTYSCLVNLGKRQQADELAKQFSLKIATNSTEQNEDLTEEELIEEGSRKEFRNLMKTYIAASGPAKKEIFDQLLQHPQAEYYANDLTIAQIYESAHKNAIEIQKGLDQHFKLELNYQLAENLERYYFVTLKNLFAVDPNEAVLKILRQLAANDPLPISYLNYSFFKIDEATRGDQWPEISNLRFQHWQASPLEKGPHQLKKAEAALAFLKGEAYLCRNPKSKECKEAGALKTITDFSPEMKQFGKR